MATPTSLVMCAEGEITKLDRAGSVVFVTFSILIGQVWIPMTIPIKGESATGLTLDETMYITLERRAE